MSRPTLSKGAGVGDQAHLRDAVTEAQSLLIKHGEALTADGQFGSGTEAAVKRFQQASGASGLLVSGVVDADTWAALDKPKTYLYQRKDLQTVPLAPTDPVNGTGDWRSKAVINAWNSYGGLISALASELGIAPSAACAVLAIESSGKGFGADGRQIIRFENHVFKSRTSLSVVQVQEHFRWDASKSWLGHHWRAAASDPWIEQHTKTSGQDGEWAVLAFARSLDDTGALLSISMGSPQIMGFNHEKIGYPDVQAMFSAFSSSDHAHVFGLFDFIMSDARMPMALRQADWRGFASVYNGSGQADDYGEHIRKGVEVAKALGIP